MLTSKYLNGFRVTKTDLKKAVSLIVKDHKEGKSPIALKWSNPQELVDYLARGMNFSEEDNVFVLSLPKELESAPARFTMEDDTIFPVSGPGKNSSPLHPSLVEYLRAIIETESSLVVVYPLPKESNKSSEEIPDKPSEEVLDDFDD